MERELVADFTRDGKKALWAWFVAIISVISLFAGYEDIAETIFYKIIAVVFGGYAVYILTRKIRFMIYRDGFVSVQGSSTTQVDFNKLLGIKFEKNQEVSFLMLAEDISRYTREEINRIIQEKSYTKIEYDDHILYTDFRRLFELIEEIFNEYVFLSNNNDTEMILNSVYVFEQIEGNMLKVTKNNFMSEKVVDIYINNGDTVAVKYKNKSFLAHIHDKSSRNASFEPRWNFSGGSQKIDTRFLFNKNIIQELLERKYNLKFIRNN